MRLKEIPKSLKSSFMGYFSKENFEFIKLLYLISIIFCSIVAIIGFFSLAFSIYFGDNVVRFLLLVIALIFTYFVYYSFFVLKKRKQMIGLTIFTIIVYLLVYLLPLFPPKYGLRDYDVDASILKFVIVSISLVIVGVMGSSLTFRPRYRFTSKSKEKSAYYILIVSILLVLYPLIILISSIVTKGVGGISWDFLTMDVRKLGTEGGIYPCIVGSIFLMIGTAIVAIPLGVGCAIYLQEYARKGLITRIISICVDILQGTPSIVHALFGLAFFVPIFGISLLTGILTLGFLTLPIVIRSSEEAFRSVPQNIREGAYAVGATKWQAIRTVVLPPALPGIITGSVLGLGRAVGETAPIMFTAVYFFGAGVPNSLLDPIHALPYHLHELTKLIGYKEVTQNAWATAFVLLAIVLGMNAIAIIIRERFRVEF